MNEKLHRAHGTLLFESQLLLNTLEANLHLLAHCVKDVLSGDEQSLAEDELEVANAVSHVMCHCVEIASGILRSLEMYRKELSGDHHQELEATLQVFDELTRQWTALSEGVEHALVLRRPPN